MATFNLNTPNIPDEADILTQLRQIRSYITNLNNQLRYDLSNIDEDNLTGGELPENAISRGFRQKVLDLQGNMSVFEQTATHILARVENAEGDISTLEQTATSFGTRITNAEGDISTLEQTATSFGTRITNAEGDISTLEQTATSFDTRITNTEGDISTLEQTAQGLQTEVTNAKGDISGLQQTATGLQTQVNNLGNRNRTYLPSTVPSETERVEGDLLIDTANGNILKRWNGSAWAAVQDGAISIAQQQADKIQWLVASGTSAANMALTSRLYSLMAANIDLSANNSIKLAVSGGTNLAPGTSRDYRSISFANTSIVSLGSYTLSELGITPGEKITASVTLNNSGATRMCLVFVSRNPTDGWLSWSPSEYAAANSVVKLSAPLVTHESATLLSVYIVTEGEVAVTANRTYKELQIERGSMATDWSPSPEDPASGVKTSFIEIATDHIDISSGGDLNLGANADLNIQNGSNLNVLNGGDIEINNGGEINVASGGKINITTTNDLVLGGQNITAFADGRIDAKANSINFTANESIILAASGGTNYYSKSTGYGTYTNAGTLVINGRDQAGYENGFYITGPEGSSLNYVRLGGVITENGYWTVSFDVRGIQGVAVPVTVDICDLGAKKFYTNATNTYERKSLTVNVTNFSAVYHFVDFGAFDYVHYMIRNIKVEKGTMATDWSPSPSDPASGVKTSYIDIATDHIDISSGGSLSITSPNTLKITSGTTNATALAVRNDTDYFISAGHLTQSSAPFWIKKDGSVKATSGVIGGFSLSSGKLIDTATSGSKMEIDPVNGILDVGDLRITQSSSHIDLFNQQVTGPTYMRIMNNVGSISLMVATSPTTDTTLQVAQNNFYALGGTFTMESLYSQGDVSALSFTDRTPAYIGDALSDLRGVGNDKHGNLDHKTLPKAARKQIRYTQKSKDESTDDREEEGRDIGMMVSILTKAIQQLTEIVEKQQVQINQLLGERT